MALRAGESESIEINTSMNLTLEEEKDQVLDQPPPARAEMQGEQRLIVLVKDSNADSPPKRLDFSGLKAEKSEHDPELVPRVKIRSGSLSEKRGMEFLIQTSRDTAQQDSPSVLIIRSKKHSLDANEVGQELEAETYKQQISV